MKPLLAIPALCLALAAPGCGGGDDATGTEAQAPRDPRFATISDDGGKDKPYIEPPDRPPPKKVLTRDLEEGSGPPARRGDWVFVHYVGVKYETGVEIYRVWPPQPPLQVRLGFGNDGEGWEEGIEGMRAGGRREIIVPSHLLYDSGTFDYVVDLVRIKPRSGKP